MLSRRVVNARMREGVDVLEGDRGTCGDASERRDWRGDSLGERMDCVVHMRAVRFFSGVLVAECDVSDASKSCASVANDDSV